VLDMSDADVVPRPAATVVLLRPAPTGPEVLLTQRPSTMAFAGDMYVFPGGAVDAADRDPRLERHSVLSAAAASAALGGQLGGVEALARFGAAVRELFEEVGVLLADPLPAPAVAAEVRAQLLDDRTTLADVAERLDLRLRTDLLVPISHWTTPPVMARRFDTRFFVAELPPGSEISVAPSEIVGHRWMTPGAALAAMADGEIAMWVPTSTTLQQLEYAPTLDEIRRSVVHGPVAAPHVIVERQDLARIVASGAGGVPGQTVNMYLLGRHDVVVFDPGDPSDEAARALIDAAAQLGGRPALIALTSTEPDHAAGAEGLALRLGIPIAAGPGAARAVPYEIRELADGEQLSLDAVTVTAVTTPGPRPEQVAYITSESGAPERLAFVGDLLGGRAAGAILAPGDQATWRASLERLGTLRLGRILPGHGEPIVPAAATFSAAATPRDSGGG
jgi:ribonuclease/clavin/mitogillin